MCLSSLSKACISYARFKEITFGLWIVFLCPQSIVDSLARSSLVVFAGHSAERVSHSATVVCMSSFSCVISSMLPFPPSLSPSILPSPHPNYLPLSIALPLPLKRQKQSIASLQCCQPKVTLLSRKRETKPGQINGERQEVKKCEREVSVKAWKLRWKVSD